jgi:hypothetical protein
MAGVLQHLRSSTLNKRPNPASMVDGQVAINYASGSPGMFFKDSNGSLVKVGPVHVGSGAPNAVPASGGTAGNSLGEQWLDTSGGTYVFKIWDGAAWRSEAGEFVNVTGDTMTGALGIIAGSAGSPSLFISGDANTGLYSPGADQLAISTNGTARLFVASDGKVGLGTSSPAAQLDVAGGINSSSDFSLNSDSFIYSYKAGALGDVRSALRLDGTNRVVQFYTDASERMRIDSSGRLGLGTSSPGFKLTIEDATTPRIRIGDGTRHLNVDGGSATQNAAIGTDYAGSFGIYTNGAANTRLHVTSAGNVGIGVTSPGHALQVNGAICATGTFGTASASTVVLDVSGDARILTTGPSGGGYNPLAFAQVNSSGGGYTERARIDSSGRLLVGTSSSSSASRFVVQGNVSGGNYASMAIAYNSGGTISPDVTLGELRFTDQAAGNTFASITCSTDGTAGTSDYPGRLVFSTTADGASGPTERMRINNAGACFLNNTDTDPAQNNIDGCTIGNSNGAYLSVTRNGGPSAFFNRRASDGTIVSLRQDGTEEGTISVSGTTVSYNGAHLSRWSQLPGGAERTEILRGTVLSNIDEMCEWGDEDNEQLNRMQVSDIEGDPNVSGVFQAWDDDDDTYTDDFYCAMTGDFIIRIAEGVTVQRGDLLMSAGDGTAKPQDDDIIRSKTIAKVISTHVTCTYDDGSYCVPCVLMAC